jgi:hypothetical protein
MHYIVAGKVDLESTDIDSAKIFFFESQALAYGQSLISGQSPRYDNFTIVEREIE